MLLAAVVAALLVVADSVVNAYADGHLLLGWICLWAVGFAATGLLANTTALQLNIGTGHFLRIIHTWTLIFWHCSQIQRGV